MKVSPAMSKMLGIVFKNPLFYALCAAMIGIMLWAILSVPGFVLQWVGGFATGWFLGPHIFASAAWLTLKVNKAKVAAALDELQKETTSEGK